MVDKEKQMMKIFLGNLVIFRLFLKINPQKIMSVMENKTVLFSRIIQLNELILCSSTVFHNDLFELFV